MQLFHDALEAGDMDGERMLGTFYRDASGVDREGKSWANVLKSIGGRRYGRLVGSVEGTRKIWSLYNRVLLCSIRSERGISPLMMHSSTGRHVVPALSCRHDNETPMQISCWRVLKFYTCFKLEF